MSLTAKDTHHCFMVSFMHVQILLNFYWIIKLIQIHPNNYSPLRLSAQEGDHEIVSYFLDAAWG